MRMREGMRGAHTQDNQVDSPFVSEVKDGLVDRTELSSKCQVVRQLSGQTGSKSRLEVALLIVGLGVSCAFRDMDDGQPGLVLSRERCSVGCRAGGIRRQIRWTQDVA
jgi:hypothetical protein